MRSTAKYLHSLAQYQSLDTMNAELASAEPIEPALARSAAHETRRTPKISREAFTESERAWFRKPIRALLALAVGGGLLVASAGRADADPVAGRAESPAMVQAKRALADARDHVRDVRASERSIKAHAHDAKRAAKLRAELVKVEARIAGQGGK